jgi:hypothetical protein
MVVKFPPTQTVSADATKARTEPFTFGAKPLRTAPVLGLRATARFRTWPLTDVKSPPTYRRDLSGDVVMVSPWAFSVGAKPDMSAPVWML